MSYFFHSAGNRGLSPVMKQNFAGFGKWWAAPVFLFMLGVSAAAEARINVVGGNSPGDSGIVKCGESPQASQNGYASIQSAIDASSDGDTVVICPGIYSYSTSILVNKRLTLESSTLNRADVTIQNHTTTVVSITARDTTLRALTVYSNPEHAIHASGADNLRLDGVTSNSEFGNGLRLQNLDGARLTNFRSTGGNYDAAIRLVNAGNLTLDGTANLLGSRQRGIVGDDGRAANLKITGLTISPAVRNTGSPISLANAGRVEIRNSVITAVYGGDGGTAISLSRGTGHHVFDNLAVKADSYGHGIYLDGGDGATFTDTDIESTGDNPHPALRLLNQRGNVSFRAVNKPRVKLTAWSRYRQDYNAHALRLAAASPLTLTLDRVDLRAYHKGVWQAGSAVGTNFTGVTVTASEEGVLIENGAGQAQVLTDVTVTAGRRGIELNGSSNARLSNLTINAGGWAARGLSLLNPVNPVLTGVNNVTISSGNSSAIHFSNCTSGGRVSGATVDGLGARDAWGTPNQGIVMDNCSGVEVSGNTVKNTLGGGINIAAGSNSASVYGNRVENASIGIRLQANSGRAWDNCLLNASNASASVGSEFYSTSMPRGNYWGSWPVGTGYSVTCTDSNDDGICDARFGYQSGKWDEYPLKTLPNCGGTPPVKPANFECIETGATYNNRIANPALRNPLYTKLAGAPFAFDVVALKADGSVETQFAAAANKDVTVELVEGSGTTACASRAAITPAVSQTLTFAAANKGRKSASMTVGKAYPDLRCRVTDANQSPSIVGCSTDNFAVRPPAFTVTSTNATNTGTSGASTFKAGSDNFNLTASAVAGYGGTPLVNNTLAIGTPTAGTITGSFGAASIATGVAAGNAFTYSEVGNLGLDANAVHDDSFTGVDQPGDCTDDFSNSLVGGKYGCKIGSLAVAQTTGSSGFGRFIPNHFVLSAASIPQAGGSFSYMGQPFGVAFTLTAVNASGGTTTNYAGSFAKLDVAAANLWPSTTLGATGFGLGAKDGGSDLSTRLSVVGTPTGTWTTGAATVAAKLKFSRPTTSAADATWGPYDALDIGIAPQDGDGVKLLPAALNLDADGNSTNERQKLSATPTRQRFGRLRLINAYGSELLPLRVEGRTEYWDGTRWVLNADDSATTIPLNGMTMDPGGIAANTCFLTNPPPSAPTNASCQGAGSPATSFSGGRGSWVVFDRVTPQVGHVDVTVDLSAMPWLQGWWSGSATGYIQDPRARIRFGSPKAPYIFLRERY